MVVRCRRTPVIETRPVDGARVGRCRIGVTSSATCQIVCRFATIYAIAEQAPDRGEDALGARDHAVLQWVVEHCTSFPWHVMVGQIDRLQPLYVDYVLFRERDCLRPMWHELAHLKGQICHSLVVKSHQVQGIYHR
jgi:hypothetical protein